MALYLKHKAYQILIDKLDVATFEEYLYTKVEESIQLKSDSLLFDLLCIDFKYDNYKKAIKNLIEDSCSEEELLSLEVYEKCLEITQAKTIEVIYVKLDELRCLYLEKYIYEILYGFYLLEIEKDSIDIGFSIVKEDELLEQIKDYASNVLNRFELYMVKEDWSGFLDCIIEKEIEKQEKVKTKKIVTIENDKKEGWFKKKIDFFISVLGLK